MLFFQRRKTSLLAELQGRQAATESRTTRTESLLERLMAQQAPPCRKVPVMEYFYDHLSGVSSEDEIDLSAGSSDDEGGIASEVDYTSTAGARKASLLSLLPTTPTIPVFFLPASQKSPSSGDPCTSIRLAQPRCAVSTTYIICRWKVRSG